MSNITPFKCPHGSHTAFYYGGQVAGCPIHGSLLYTDIPREIKDKNFIPALEGYTTHRKGHGWITAKDAIKELKQSIVKRFSKILFL